MRIRIEAVVLSLFVALALGLTPRQFAYRWHRLPEQESAQPSPP